jgi:hypothetical protein
MPKNVIDYSNTIIYKIFCNDENISDLYVGHTTNFPKRKYQHKMSCSNLNNKYKIYEIIRQNGGWDNWNMIELAKYNCKDHTEARIKEQEHYELLKANLNSLPPFTDKSKYFCNTCNLMCSSQKTYDKHIKCYLHEKKISTQYEPESEQSYVCTICDFTTSKKTDFNRHLHTEKHKNNLLATSNNTKIDKKHICDNCKKEYNDRVGLWRHKKTCNFSPENVDENVTKELTDKELIYLLLKQNSQLIEQNGELMKKLKQ